MKYLYLAVSIFFFVMCTDRKELSIDDHFIVDLHQRDEVSIQDMFRCIEIIPLETDTNCLIQRIDKVEFYQQKFYIFDYTLQSLFVFNEKGTFLFKIANKGNGPEEYLNISDFNVNRYTAEIEILAPINNSIYRYDLTGKYRGKLNLLHRTEGAYNAFSILNQDTIAFWTYDKEKHIKYYSRSKQKHVLEMYQEYWDDNFCTYEFVGNDLFCRALTNTVYRLGMDGLIPAYEWNFGSDNNEVTNFVKTNDPQKDFERDLKIIRSEIANYVLTVQLQNDHYCYAKIIREKNFIHLFYDKKKKKSILFPSFVENVTIHPIIMTNNYVLGLTGEDIPEVLQESILSDEEKEKLRKHKIDDNPMLIKYEWK